MTRQAPPRREVCRTLSVDVVYRQGRGARTARQMRIDVLVVGSRLIGNTLYLVTTWSPDLTRFSVAAATRSGPWTQP